MRSTSLLAAALVACPAFADANKALGFFQDLGNNMVNQPLRFADGGPGEETPLVLATSNRIASEVDVYHGLAFTSSGAVGFLDSYLTQGPTVPAARWELNPDSSIKGFKFHSCAESGYFGEKITNRDLGTCDLITVSLKVFDKTSGEILGDAQTELGRSGLEEGVPQALFVRVGGYFRPLFPSQDRKSLLWGISAINPVPIGLSGLRLFTKNSAAASYVGFDHGKLVHSPSVPLHDFSLDDSMRVGGARFYSCANDQDPVHEIRDTSGGCPEVGLYLLPYGKYGLPTHPKYALPESEVYPKDVSERPLVLFAKAKGVFHPLSSSFFDVRARSFSILTYEVDVPPVEFRLENSRPVSTNIVSAGRAGVVNDLVVVGAHQDAEALTLDSRDGKLQGGKYCSCHNAAVNARVITNCKLDGGVDDCFEVEIFLKKYDRKTGQPTDLDSAPEGNAKNEEDETDEESEEEKSEDGDCSDSVDSAEEGDNPSSDGENPGDDHDGLDDKFSQQEAKNRSNGEPQVEHDELDNFDVAKAWNKLFSDGKTPGDVHDESDNNDCELGEETHDSSLRK